MGFNSGFKGLNYPETPVRNFYYTLRKISEEHRFHFKCGGSL